MAAFLRTHIICDNAVLTTNTFAMCRRGLPAPAILAVTAHPCSIAGDVVDFNLFGVNAHTVEGAPRDSLVDVLEENGVSPPFLA